MEKKAAENKTMRSEWFAWVRKTRAKLSKARKTSVTHREAMQAASAGWPAEKEKLEKRKKRAARKKAKEGVQKNI